MDYLSQLYLPGAVPVWAALIFALATLFGYAQVMTGRESARPLARHAYLFFAVSVVLVAAVLAVALIRRDFRVEYVYQYSGLELAAHYQFAAFWAGQKGSFLIWLLWGALIGLFVQRAAGKAEAPVMGIYTLTVTGLLCILVRENPFVMLAETPFDGQGLNPLLQDDWMVIHPPIMFVGFALAAVPFAFAMAGLWTRDYRSWAARAYPWALAGFLVLGAAILMGGYWAYKTLGWGGYWGWDPVENASLIPWLLLVVLVHGLHLERTKGRYRKANVIIASLVYLSVLYGTFLTRSGVLADFSVHSFVDLGISGWLIALMVTFIAIPAVLIPLRWRQIPAAKNEDPILSRGAFLVMSTITVMLTAVVITFGTSAPLLTGFLANPGQVGPEWYNRVNGPLALLLIVLLALVPFLTWRGIELRVLLRKLRWPALGAALATGATVFFGVHHPLHLAVIFFALLAIVTNLQKTWERAASGGIGAAGGWLAHVGVGVILIGFLASSAYDVSAKVTLPMGEPVAINGLTLTFEQMIPRKGREKERLQVRVVRADGREYVAYPSLFINDRTRQTMAHPDVRTTLLQDLYVSPIEFDPGTQPGAPQRFQLAEGESHEVGGVEVSFAGFDVESHNSTAPMLALQQGQAITIGALLDLTAGGETTRVSPLYSFTAAGAVNAPPLELPMGGAVIVSGINANDRKVQIDVFGLGAASEGEPPRLAIDVTRKPLIQLVWFGLYVILFGGALAAFHRWQQARQYDAVMAKAAAVRARKLGR